MDPIVRGNFIQRAFPTERFQDHFSFELPTMLPSLHRHRFVLPYALPNLTYSVVHFLGYIIKLSMRSPEKRACAGQDQSFFAGETTKGLQLLEIMSGRYDVVVTNPPYMSARKIKLHTQENWSAMSTQPEKTIYMQRSFNVVLSLPGSWAGRHVDHALFHVH